MTDAWKQRTREGMRGFIREKFLNEVLYVQQDRDLAMTITIGLLIIAKPKMRSAEV